MHVAALLTRACAAVALVAPGIVAPLEAQLIGDVKLSPVSTLHADWLNEGAESPNGRFFVFRSYAGGAFIRYDRNTRQWATANGVTIGSHVRWSPDGRFLAYTEFLNQGRSVWVLPMDSSTGMPRGAARKITTARSASWPAWSPDGRRIAISVQDSGRFRIAAVPFNGGDETVLYETGGEGGDLAWSPDGTHLWAGHGTRGRATHWLRVNTSTRRVDSFPIGPVRMLGYSADGRYVAHLEPGVPVVVISSASDGRAVQRVVLPPRVRPIGWSHSTPNALTAIENVVPAHLQRVSLADGRIESITPVDSAMLGRLRYSPDGQQLAYAGQVGNANQLRVANSDGSNRRALGKPGSFGDVRWSPSGKYVAYGLATLRAAGGRDTELRIVDATTGADRQIARATGTGFMAWQSISWRRDGLAVRYVLHSRGLQSPEREVREATLDGNDRLLTKLPATEGNAHFINDTLVILRKPMGIDAVSLRNGATRSIYNGSIRAASEPGISPDGSWLVFAANNGDGMYPQLVSLSTGETRRVAYSLKGELGTIFFHPDGRSLVADACLSCVSPAYVEKWDIVVIPMNGDATRVLTASQPSYKDFGWQQISPDGRYVVFEGQQSYNTRMVTLTFPKP